MTASDEFGGALAPLAVAKLVGSVPVEGPCPPSVIVSEPTEVDLAISLDMRDKRDESTESEVVVGEVELVEGLAGVDGNDNPLALNVEMSMYE